MKGIILVGVMRNRRAVRGKEVEEEEERQRGIYRVWQRKGGEVEKR